MSTKRPRIGEMRHVLTIQKQTVTQDTMGGQVVTWVTYGTTNGSIEAAPANALHAERLSAGDALLVNVSLFLMRCRYLAGVLVNMRVYHAQSGQYFNIVDVENVDFRNAVMALTCKQVAV